jgi:hypothetical protein
LSLSLTVFQNWTCRQVAVGQGAAKVMTQNVDAVQNCLDIEKRAHDQLVKGWQDFTPADRAKCVNAVMSFSPTYTELLTCLEFSKGLKRHQ